jgi:peptidoglycan/xylan/chitin deacetylase (PgdA/CDA1 family)
MTATAPPALLLTFDVEEFDLPRELGRALDRDAECTITERGVDEILALLARHRACATFFVTARFASARPACVRAIHAAGHEIAAHGLAHADDYTSMHPADAVTRLRAARALLGQITGEDPRGIRAPRLRGPTSDVLRAAAFTYDASPHPTWIPGRYNGLRLPRAPWREDGLLRIPISVVPGIRWPVSWLWFRLLGSPANRWAASAASRGTPYLHLYFHPWEAMDIRGLVPRWIAVRSGPAFVTALDRLLLWAGPRFVARTVTEFAATLSDPAAVRVDRLSASARRRRGG